MYDPEWDLNHIWKTIRDNDAVLEAMELSEASELTIAKSIIKRSQYDDLADKQRRLCIYFRPSRRPPNDIVTEELLQIDCHVPEKEYIVAYRILKTVLYAVKNKRINGRRLKYDGQLGDLPSAPGYFSAGMRFLYYGTI